MAHAIGCLGSPVSTYRAEKEKATRRAQAKKALTHGPIRNQARAMTLAVISRDNEKTVKVVKVRQGHLHHVKAAYLHASNVMYLDKMMGTK